MSIKVHVKGNTLSNRTRADEREAQEIIEREDSPIELIKERLGKEIVHVTIERPDGNRYVISVYRLYPAELLMLNENVFSPALNRAIHESGAADNENALDIVKEALDVDSDAEALRELQKLHEKTVDIVMAALVNEKLKDKDFLLYELDPDVLRALHDAAIGRYTDKNSATSFPRMDTPPGKRRPGATHA